MKDIIKDLGQISTIRDLMISRLMTIAFQTNNFSRSLQKWENFDVKGNHISETNFKKLSDEMLVSVFERVIARNQRYG